MARVAQTAMVMAAMLAGGSVTAAAGPARNQEAVATILARADVAWADGDHAAAERDYGEVLARQPTNSRALYRLAHLGNRSAPERIALLQRYVAVESSDAWGYLALAQALAVGDRDARRAALVTLEEAVSRAPADRDIALGRPRLLVRLGRDGDAQRAYEAWLETHPDDGEVWRELAELEQRAGRLRSATVALERAAAVSPNDAAVDRRLTALGRRTAPAVELGLLGIGETDVAAIGGRISGEAQTGDSARTAVVYQQRRIASFGEMARTRRVGLQVSLRPRSDVRMTAGGGLTWTSPPAPTDTSQRHLDLGFRLRRTAARDGVHVDLRGDHGPVDVNVDVIRADLQRTQASVAVDAPLSQRWRVRGDARLGQLRTADQRNLRTAFGGGPALTVVPGVHLSGQWRQVRYREPAASGYFAPRLIDQVEAAVDVEREFEVISLGLDVGAGWHRFERHGASMGPWGPAFRAWGYIGWSLQPGLQVLIESEAYSTRIAEFVPVVASADRWRYVSVSAGLRVSRW